MARFDVFRVDDQNYLLDVQADILVRLETRVVVPLMPLDSAPNRAGELNPVFSFDGQPMVMVTQFIAAVPDTTLKNKFANLGANSDAITKALDLLFQGF